MKLYSVFQRLLTRLLSKLELLVPNILLLTRKCLETDISKAREGPLSLFTSRLKCLGLHFRLLFYKDCNETQDNQMMGESFLRQKGPYLPPPPAPCPPPAPDTHTHLRGEKSKLALRDCVRAQGGRWPPGRPVLWLDLGRQTES